VSERDDLCATIETLRGQLEGLVVRGLRVAGPSDIKALDGAHVELTRAEAHYLAGRIKTLADALRADDRSAASALLRAQMTLQVFERVLTLDAAAEAYVRTGATVAQRPARTGATAAPPLEDRKKLLALLVDLSSAVEDLVLTGVTTASEATRQKLDVSFKEASRLKLLRLGVALKYVNEELARFLSSAQDFSGKRFALFLNRSWLMARGLTEALQKNDNDTLAQLLRASAAPPIPVASMEVVPLAVSKRVVQSSCLFDFKLRLLKDTGPLRAGQSLTWSCVYPALPGVSAETQLHLPQPQKFKPKDLLEPNTFLVTDCAVGLDDAGGGRLMFGPKSTVTSGKAFSDWARFSTWDLSKPGTRVSGHTPTPLDLPVELQEEAVLTDWKIGAKMSRGRPDQDVYPISLANGLMMDAVVSTGADGSELRTALEELRARKVPPPLYGLLHYELCRFVFQPVSAFDGAKMAHLMISKEKPDLGALLKSMGK